MGAVSSTFDVGNAWHIVAASVPGAVAYGLVNQSLENAVYRPFGFAISGLHTVPGSLSDMPYPEVMTVKFQAWASSLVAHTAMHGMWWKFVLENNALSWVLDYKNWPAALWPRRQDQTERRAVGPYYIIYFSYVLHSCYKDMYKKLGRKGGSLQILFDLHHIITVVLVASSIHFGTWRGGVLTRLIHDVADIALYASKLRQAVHETTGSDASVMNRWFSLILVSWPLTRIGAYGYLCASFQRLYNNIKEKAKKEDWTFPYLIQSTGSWLMLVLQVIFFKGMVDAAVGFRRAGGVIVDPFHGKTKPV